MPVSVQNFFVQQQINFTPADLNSQRMSIVTFGCIFTISKETHAAVGVRYHAFSQFMAIYDQRLTFYIVMLPILPDTSLSLIYPSGKALMELLS